MKTKIGDLVPKEVKTFSNDDLSTWVIEGEKMNSTENKKMQLFMYSAIPARDLTEEERKGKEESLKDLRKQEKCINDFNELYAFHRAYVLVLLVPLLISLILLGFVKCH